MMTTLHHRRFRRGVTPCDAATMLLFILAAVVFAITQQQQHQHGVLVDAAAVASSTSCCNKYTNNAEFSTNDSCFLIRGGSGSDDNRGDKIDHIGIGSVSSSSSAPTSSCATTTTSLSGPMARRASRWRTSTDGSERTSAT